ncbi:transposase, Ptta/En/Spm [Tanacetum coccineum]
MDNITAVEYIKIEKKSNVARQNRLTEVDGEVSKHTAGSKTILQHKFQMEKQKKKRPVILLEAYHRTHTSTNVSSEASGSGMDEACEGRTREYVTASSKRLAGKKKGKLVGLGTRGDQRVMVTRTAATSSSSSTSNEQVQTLEEIIRRLQEENTQIRSQNQREMQIEIQRQVEQQVLEHMQQRELEANAREQAREREWQQRMNDINSVLRKFTDSRPPP